MINSLRETAVNGLLRAFDAESGVFCLGGTLTGPVRTRSNAFQRDTLISLLGLQQVGRSGVEVPVRFRTSLDAVLANLNWISGVGDLGLVLWACALVAPERFDELRRQWDYGRSWKTYRDAQVGGTTALSLFLTGLSFLGLARPETLTDTMDVAAEVYRMIRLNQTDEGFFGRCSRNKSFVGRLFGEIGNFRDQVHAIYAISKYSEAYGDHRAVQKALDCALALCERQGRQGQWWWQYDSLTGKIAKRYPVCSVHQYGIGPMAFLALGEVAHCDFSPWIYKGLLWLEENELGIDMQDKVANAIWSRVIQGRLSSAWNTVANLATGREDRESHFGLHATYECYPQELGWLLYAFADWREGNLISSAQSGFAVGS